ncbi:MAG: phosphoribosyltransferase family protein [Sedimentisphaerales bacterium]
MADLRKIKIEGRWDVGYALDLHIESSDFLGYDEFGHPKYDTTRTELGELVYKFKYGHDKTVLDAIIRIIRNSFTFKSIDVIIPVPPSKTSRTFQPVVEIAKRLGKVLGIQVLTDAVLKVKNTPELKNMSTFQEKYDILKDAFKIGNGTIKNKTILLLDDLYRSGATLTAITDLLYKKGGVSNVKVLTLTKTRRR